MGTKPRLSLGSLDIFFWLSPQSDFRMGKEQRLSQ